MHSHGVMQGVLKRLAGPERGEAILGDLLECSGGSFGLWGAFLRTAFSLGWRRVLPWLVTFGVTEALWQATGLIRPPVAHSAPNVMEIVLGVVVGLCASSACLLLAFSLVWIGWRNRFTQLCAGVGVVANLAYGLAWVHAAPRLLAGVIVVTAAGLLCRRRWRPAIMAFAAVCVQWWTATAILFFGAMALVHGDPGWELKHPVGSHLLGVLFTVAMLVICARSIEHGDRPVIA